MFANVGVVVDWHSGKPRSQDEVPANGLIVVDFEMKAPSDSNRSAMAYALPYEGVHIVVLYDRIRSATRDNPVQRPAILAHVMTHEITHILQGQVHHSATGVMKVRWDGADYFDMTQSPLPFAPEDIELLRRGLQRRERLARAR
jgi:hypothetical protein